MKIKTLLKEMFLTPGVIALFLPVCILLFLLLGLSLAFSEPHRGAAYETWEQGGRMFKVRATAYYEEGGGFVPGAYYAFESSPAGSDAWEEFAAFRVDDPNPIPRERLHFVKENVAYVHMPGAYVVTVDGGRCWTTWEPRLAPPGGESVYWSIQELSVGPDGRGAAKLQRYDERVKDMVYLEVSTEDYGLHWSPHQAAKDNAGKRPAAVKAKSR